MTRPFSKYIFMLSEHFLPSITHPPTSHCLNVESFLLLDAYVSEFAAANKMLNAIRVYVGFPISLGIFDFR